MSIISLLSDFGHKDPYVAEMKAVILSVNPQVRFVDITHEITKFCIPMGAYTLASAAPFFPLNTVHVAVVDPGVGTNRRPIIVHTQRNLYVGPDNGLLILAANKEKITKVYVIDNPKYMLATVSNTFHGRDIFAPVAAHLSKGVKPCEFGSEINDYVCPKFTTAHFKDAELVGEVLHVDDFGNVISNISVHDLEKLGLQLGCSVRVELGDNGFNVPFGSAYGEVACGDAVLLVGGGDFVEVSVNQGNASKLFNENVGDTFCLSLVKC